jgi:hypothetical protein
LNARRQFLLLPALLTQAAGAQSPGSNDKARQYLSRLLAANEEVTAWLQEKLFPFCKYDSGLGYLHRDRQFKEGIYGSICTYTYDKSDARHTINYAHQPCRVNTYGNSFTSCEQVNDGETWQEVLAAHLCEPVRNYGIGGYSVYLAYLRMLREEQRNPARYVVINIFDDDHFRNLISWQRITSARNTKSFHPTLPHVVVNPSTGAFVERPNPCPTPKSVYNLCDLDWVYATFKDDFVLKIRLAQEAAGSGGTGDLIQQLARDHGITTNVNYSGDELRKTAGTLYTQAALFSSKQIVEKIESFASSHGKKVVYVLSYGPNNIAKALNGEPRFDQSFVDFLKAKRLPFVDLMEAHVTDFANFRCTVKDYIGRYYIGHYGPAGNAFCAFALKDKLVAMLEPKPVPYRA